jgi:hypothetical protein
MPSSLERAFAVWFCDLGETFDVDPAALGRKLPLYFEALASLGPDLIELAIRRCIANCKFFPRPAEIKEQVAGELDQQAKETNRRLRERAMLPAPREENGWQATTPEQRAMHEVMMAELKRALGGPTHERRPLPPHCERDEVRPMRALSELLAGFRLPAADDPRVLARMREIGDTGGDR